MAADYETPQPFTTHTVESVPSSSPPPQPPPSSVTVSESAARRQECEQRPSFCYYYTRRRKRLKKDPFFKSSFDNRVFMHGGFQETDSRNGIEVSKKSTGTSADARASSLLQASHEKRGERSASGYSLRQVAKKRAQPQSPHRFPSSPKKRLIVSALPALQGTDLRNGERVTLASLKMPEKNIILSTQSVGDRNRTMSESRMGQVRGSGSPTQDVDRANVNPSMHVEIQNGDALEPLCSSIDTVFLKRVADAFKDSAGNLEEEIVSIKGPHTVKPSLQKTLSGILKVYGDITKDCPLESGNYILTEVLEGICNVVQELQKKRLTGLSSSLLNCYYSAVIAAEAIKLDVKWLRDQLDEIKEAVKSAVETKKILDEKSKCTRKVEKRREELKSMNVELEKLNSKIKGKEKMLALDIAAAEMQSEKLLSLVNRFMHFQGTTLMKTF